MRRLPVAAAVSALAAVLAGRTRGPGRLARPADLLSSLAVGSGGAVASMDLDASQAGIDVLKRGGNAVDAAVATASALGVTIPFVAGPGGGGFMVIYLAKTHQVVTIDGRENCPAACATTMFLDPKTGQPLDYDYASTSRRPLACPRWWPPGPRRSASTGARAWPPTSSRPSGWPSAGSGSTRTSSSSPSPTCRNCRPTRPAGLCCSRRRGSPSRSARCFATRTWPRPTGCWPGTGRPTCTTGPSARPSSRPMTTRC